MEKQHVSRTADGRSHFNTLVLRTCWVRLFDPFNEPMPHAPYRVTLGNRRWEGEADADAWLKLGYAEQHARCFIEWGRAEPPPGHTGESATADGTSGHEQDRYSSPSGELSGGQADEMGGDVEPAEDGVSEPAGTPSPYLYELELHLDLSGEDSEEAIRRRLYNLGFDWGEDLAQNIRAFQRAFNRPVTGLVQDIAPDLRQWHDDCAPERWLAST